MNYLLRRFLLLVLIPSAALCHRAGAALGDTTLVGFSVVCAAAAVVVLVVGNRARIDWWLGGDR